MAFQKRLNPVAQPLPFDAPPDDRTEVEVLLWHERGLATGV
jgi:hypothetical protein